MPKIDFVAVSTPNFTRPELLRHSTIPQPMFGTAPRVVMGQEWWDKTRREAYAKNNMRCWACGGEGPLEAHEAYRIDYRNAEMIYVETTALCNDCHSFIHIGRTIGMLARGERKHSDVKRIVLRGYEILKKAKLKCPYETSLINNPRLAWPGNTSWMRRVLKNTERTNHMDLYWMKAHPWERWRLVFDGQKYPPRYKSYEEFQEEGL